MAEALGDDLHLDARGEGQAGMGVAKIVKPDGWQAHRGCECLEVSGRVLGSQQPAILPGEHEPSLVPRRAPGDSLEVLGLAVSAEHRHGVGIKGDEPGSSLGLGSADNRAAVDLGDLLDDEEALTVEVDVLPAKPDRLAAAHAGDEHQLVEVGEAVIGGVVNEDVALLWGPRLGPLGVLRGELDVLSRAVGDEPALDRGVEG